MISEEDRYDLHRGLEEALGTKRAATLMEHLPPVGWADVATKRDIDALQVATKHDLDALQVATKHDIDALQLSVRAELATGLRSNLQWMVTTQLAVAGMIIAAVRI